MSTMEAMSFEEEKKIFAKVKDISDYRRLNREERAEYDAALRRYRDYNVTLLTAQQEGRAGGRAEGRAEGIVEGQTKIVKSMRDYGMCLSEISNATGLSVSEIENLLS